MHAAEPTDGLDRRSFGKKLAVGVGAAWVAPAVISVRAAHAATCPPIPPSPPPLLTGANTAFITPALNADTAAIQDASTPPMTVVFAESGPSAPLASPLAIDHDGSAGTFVQPFGGATVPTGAVVYSYLVHARLTTTAPSGVFIGSLTVPPELVVLGFAASTDLSQTGILEGTTSLGRPDITYRYLSASGEGLEAGATVDPVDPAPDSVTIGVPGPGGTAVAWHLFTGGIESDEFRLLLGPAPCGSPPP